VWPKREHGHVARGGSGAPPGGPWLARETPAGCPRQASPACELRTVAANGLKFEFRAAKSLGRSQPLATVTVGPPLSAGQTEALRFNPWTPGPGIRPSGWLNLLRDAAYRASQRSRR
jgi:hypothetical protein